MKFSKTTGCFYPEDIHYENPPADLIEVTREDYAAAMSRAPGETLDVINGKLVIVPAPPPDPVAVLAAAKAGALERINAYAKTKRAEIAGTTDDAEIAGWSNKLRIAQAITAGTATDADRAAFQAEITARGIEGETLALFTQKVITSADFFSKAAGLVDGLKRKAQDLVKVAQTPEDIATVLDTMKAQADAAFDDLMRHAG